MDALVASPCRTTIESLKVDGRITGGLYNEGNSLYRPGADSLWFERLPHLPSLTELEMPANNLESPQAWVEAVAVGCPKYVKPWGGVITGRCAVIFTCQGVIVLLHVIRFVMLYISLHTRARTHTHTRTHAHSTPGRLEVLITTNMTKLIGSDVLTEPFADWTGVSNAFPSLRVLTMHFPFKSGHVALLPVTLEHLSIPLCRLVGISTIEAIVERCPELKTLGRSFDGAVSSTSDGVRGGGCVGSVP